MISSLQNFGNAPFSAASKRVTREDFLRLGNDQEFLSDLLAKYQKNQDFKRQIAAWQKEPEYPQKLEVFYDTASGKPSVSRLGAEQALVAFLLDRRTASRESSEAFAERIRSEIGQIQQGALLPGNDDPVRLITPEESIFAVLQEKIAKNSSDPQLFQDQEGNLRDFSEKNNRDLPPDAALAWAGIKLWQAGVASTVPSQAKGRISVEAFAQSEKSNLPAQKEFQLAVKKEFPNQTAVLKTPNETEGTGWVEDNFDQKQYQRWEREIKKRVGRLKPELPTTVQPRVSISGSRKKRNFYGPIGAVVAVIGGIAWASTPAKAAFDTFF